MKNGRMTLQIVCFIVLSIASDYVFGYEPWEDDDGSAFSVIWTEEDVKNCPTDTSRSVSVCDEVKVGDDLKVPSLQDCIAWVTVDANDAFDAQYYCRRFRYECHVLAAVRAAKTKVVDPNLSFGCADSYKQLWLEYSQGKKAMDVMVRNDDIEERPETSDEDYRVEEGSLVQHQ